MSYKVKAQMARDSNLIDRITACVAEADIPNPDGWSWGHGAKFAAQEGWVAAYLAADPSNPGGDETAITDAMILAAVTALNV